MKNQILLYLYHNSDINKEILRDLVDELPSQLKDVSMTTYARIKLEGKLEGKLEEKLERDTYVIKRGLAKGYSVEDLADLTGLSLSEVIEIINGFEEKNSQNTESNKTKK